MGAAAIGTAAFDEDAASEDIAVSAAAEGVAQALARRDNAFPIQYYCEQAASLLDTRGKFADPLTLCQRFHKA